MVFWWIYNADFEKQKEKEKPRSYKWSAVHIIFPQGMQFSLI